MKTDICHGISVITIVLNGEDFIEQTILSVLNQKNDNIEYIVVDGGSVDGTLEIISRYKENIEIVISERDNGIYDALNKGISRAKYEIIGLIHCGDFYESQILMEVLNEFNRTSADVLCGNIRFIEEIGDRRISRILIPDHTQLRDKMTVYHPATFIRRECYSLYGFYSTDYKIAADYDLLLNLFLHGLKFIYFPAVIANFRAGGISGKGEMRLLKENFLIRKQRIGSGHAYKYLAQTGLREMFFLIRKFLVQTIIGQKAYQRLKLLKAEKELQLSKNHN